MDIEKETGNRRTSWQDLKNRVGLVGIEDRFFGRVKKKKFSEGGIKP